MIPFDSLYSVLLYHILKFYRYPQNCFQALLRRLTCDLHFDKLKWAWFSLAHPPPAPLCLDDSHVTYPSGDFFLLFSGDDQFSDKLMSFFINFSAFRESLSNYSFLSEENTNFSKLWPIFFSTFLQQQKNKRGKEKIIIKRSQEQAGEFIYTWPGLCTKPWCPHKKPPGCPSGCTETVQCMSAMVLSQGFSGLC